MTAEAVRAFAEATGTPWHDGQPAPATFAIVPAFEAMQAMLEDPSVGIELQHVVHADQRFSYQRPIVVGDRLDVVLTIDRVRSAAGADVITTSCALTDAGGELVCVSGATLMHRSAS